MQRLLFLLGLSLAASTAHADSITWDFTTAGVGDQQGAVTFTSADGHALTAEAYISDVTSWDPFAAQFVSDGAFISANQDGIGVSSSLIDAIWGGGNLDNNVGYEVIEIVLDPLAIPRNTTLKFAAWYHGNIGSEYRVWANNGEGLPGIDNGANIDIPGAGGELLASGFGSPQNSELAVTLNASQPYTHLYFGTEVDLSIADLDAYRIKELTVTAVPIPAAAWLFGSALVGMAGIGYRRSRSG